MTDEKELKDQRVPIMMTSSELEAIDDWMFRNRIRSRGEAIRRLCQVGLARDDVAEHVVGDVGAMMKAFADGMNWLNTSGHVSQQALRQAVKYVHEPLVTAMLRLVLRLQEADALGAAAKNRDMSLPFDDIRAKISKDFALIAEVADQGPQAYLELLNRAEAKARKDIKSEG